MTQPTSRGMPEPQRLRALERANQIRLARASLKRQIAHGEVLAADVILARPPEAQSWPISELLMSQRRWGSSRCRKFLARNQIVETKAIGTLTERQCRILASALKGGIEARAPAGAEDAPAPAMELAVA